MKSKTHKRLIKCKNDVWKHQLAHAAIRNHQNMASLCSRFLIISGNDGPLILLGSAWQWQQNRLLSLVKVGCLKYAGHKSHFKHCLFTPTYDHEEQ